MAVRIVEEVDAPIERVWSFVSDFYRLERWNPMIERTDKNGNDEGIGSVRTIRFPVGWLDERLERHDPENFTLVYSVTGLDRPGSPDIVGMVATIQLTALSPTQTRLTWISERTPPLSGEVEEALSTLLPTRVGHLREALEIA